MKVHFNNTELDIDANISLSALVTQVDLPDTGFAVAINNSVIPKIKWDETFLSEADKIVVIKATCGG